MLLVNASINLYPIEVLPRIFHYGFGAPFYNYSRIVRTIVFGTKNRCKFHLLLVAHRANGLFSGFSGVELWRPYRVDSCVMYKSHHHTMERETTGDPGKEGIVET